MVDVEKQVEAKPVVASFLIENVVRRQGTRLHRARAITRHRFKQYVGGQRLLRNKKLSLREDMFRKEEAKIVELLKAGVVAVYTPKNIRITTLPDGRYVLTKMETGGHKILAAGEAPGFYPEVKVATVRPTVSKAESNGKRAHNGSKKHDDLTELPSIGGGRAKKLMAAGINTFAQIANMAPFTLAANLGIDEGTAGDIIRVAKGK